MQLLISGTVNFCPRLVASIRPCGRFSTAQQLDPLSPIVHASVGIILYQGRRYDQAIKKFVETLELFPNPA